MTTQAELDRAGRLRNSEVCPVETCGKGISARMLMCAAHWRLVPAPVKRAVYASARKLWGESDEDAGVSYRRWRDDALEAIRCVEEGDHA